MESSASFGSLFLIDNQNIDVNVSIKLTDQHKADFSVSYIPLEAILSCHF